MHPDNLSWLGDGHRGTVGENDYTLSVFYAFILLQIFFFYKFFFYSLSKIVGIFFTFFFLSSFIVMKEIVRSRVFSVWNVLTWKTASLAQQQNRNMYDSPWLQTNSFISFSSSVVLHFRLVMAPPSLDHLDNTGKILQGSQLQTEVVPNDGAKEINEVTSIRNRKAIPQRQSRDQFYYTAEEVLQHDKEDDCWLIVDGSVYNVTKWIPRHPGKNEKENITMWGNAGILLNSIKTSCKIKQFFVVPFFVRWKDGDPQFGWKRRHRFDDADASSFCL